jgi:hypothetical protein
MWQLRRLRTLWASTAYHRGNFTLPLASTLKEFALRDRENHEEPASSQTSILTMNSRVTLVTVVLYQYLYQICLLKANLFHCIFLSQR